MKSLLSVVISLGMGQGLTNAAVTSFTMSDSTSIIQSTAGTYTATYFTGSFVSEGDYTATIGEWYGHQEALAPTAPTQFTASVTSQLTVILELWNSDYSALLQSVSATGNQITASEIGGGIWGQAYDIINVYGPPTGGALSMSGTHTGTVNLLVKSQITWSSLSHFNQLYLHTRSSNYQDPWVGQFETNAVPEPSSLLLLTIGSFGLIRRRRSI